ncbi:MAG: hypothetical protein IJD14_04835 [Christensenellaceae bacterium]|nr:hypothetical protein [Christensenellaceae bacterium]
MEKNYVNENEAKRLFIASSSLLELWRAQGLPFIEKNGERMYPLEDCRSWFAGTYKA